MCPQGGGCGSAPASKQRTGLRRRARCLAGGRWDGGRPARDRCDWRPRPWPARVAVVVAWRASRRGHSALRAPATSRWALAWCSRPGAGRRRFGAGCLLARSPIAATCSPSPGASQQALVSAPRPRWSRACPPACRRLLPGGSYADQARHPSGQVIGSGLRPACPRRRYRRRTGCQHISVPARIGRFARSPYEDRHSARKRIIGDPEQLHGGLMCSGVRSSVA